MPRGVKKAPLETAAAPAVSQTDLTRLGDPRGAAQALRALLRARVEAVLALGALDKEAADELAKIASLLEKLEASGYDLKAAAIEVGERLVARAAAQPGQAERKAWLADLLEGLYASLEQEG